MPQIILNNNLIELEKLTLFLQNLGTRFNLSQKIIFELNLILDELVTNVITHGFTTTEKHEIKIIVNVLDNKIVIEMIDDAEAFNPLNFNIQSTNKSVSERKIGGLGIFIVKQKADELSYKRLKNKNHLYIVKYINKESK